MKKNSRKSNIITFAFNTVGVAHATTHYTRTLQSENDNEISPRRTPEESLRQTRDEIGSGRLL